MNWRHMYGLYELRNFQGLYIQPLGGIITLTPGMIGLNKTQEGS